MCGILKQGAKDMIYDDKKFIGEVIKAARKNAGLNQAQLCEKLGMTDKNLGNIENGRQFPQVNNFLRIIEVLNLKMEDFGVKTSLKQENEPDKEKLLKFILSLTEKQSKAYLKILQDLNDIKEAL